jgi:DNA-binding transcriptional MocR family regulator
LLKSLAAELRKISTPKQAVLLHSNDFRVSTWITTSSDQIFTTLLNDHDFFPSHIQQYKIKLRESHAQTTSFLQKHGIRFAPSNAGFFIWVNLSPWLKYFPKPDDNSKMGDYSSQEMQLTRYLIKQGVFLNPSEASDNTIG